MAKRALNLPKAVLFDFDGTFADTAPDMAFAANLLRNARGLDSLPLWQYRPHVSRGGRGMVGVAFDVTPDDAQFHALRDEFLDMYEQHLCVHTAFFDGINEMVTALEQRNIAWGIVTNKYARFTTPLTTQLGLTTRTACIVSGDTTPHAKPHPGPLLHAASLLAVEAEACWYVGDDERDIQAAHAAGMAGIIASYGYLGGSDHTTWNADASIAAPIDLLKLLPAANG
jgi:N-acetyl-D-muramate 6-phosphate phosphatase